MHNPARADGPSYSGIPMMPSTAIPRRATSWPSAVWAAAGCGRSGFGSLRSRLRPPAASWRLPSRRCTCFRSSSHSANVRQRFRRYLRSPATVGACGNGPAEAAAAVRTLRVGEPQRNGAARKGSGLPRGAYAGSAALALAVFGWRSRWRGKWLVGARGLRVAIGIQLAPFGEFSPGCRSAPPSTSG